MEQLLKESGYNTLQEFPSFQPKHERAKTQLVSLPMTD